ncbi:hypothetical protein D7Z54_14585 [Salibacterium salarium]|uniref:Pycsar effector protein domain-containing protein n=1 Tax=Salibacterium salarium TaxID=284579 RepID=A0A428N2K4_9BACI|nr:Pycsar system effector family protein [Salibacterium salarium]RSL32673.1 hypothetical protein D7Z54_14585 [Salibacterium salarium]
MEKLEVELQYKYELVNNWLKYAETKNSAVLVFTVAIITLIMNSINDNNMNSYMSINSKILLTFMSLACLVSLKSFLPKLKLDINNKKDISNNDNLHYFNHLSKYTPEQLIDAMSLQYYEDAFGDLKNKYNIDLANQIVINSNIAVRKFKHFKCAAYLVFVGIVVFSLISTLLSLFGGSLC